MPDSMPTARIRPAAPPPDAPLQEWTAHLLAVQAAACAVLGSRLYEHLLTHAADDVRAGGPAWAVLERHATRDTGAAIGLRLMAAVHRVVLTGQAPRLARHYASAGGDADPQGSWPALRSLMAERADELGALVALPCQTNEVGRCAALIGGFLIASREASASFRLLEIGASAGLNLRWDRYRYEHAVDGRTWGDRASPVVLRGHWEVPHGLLDEPARVVGRSGCDPRPVDPLTDDGRLALAASVWGDQPARFQRLRGALDIAAGVPVDVEQAHAIDWLPPRLAEAHAGATVVFHSVVMQYIDPDERRAVVDAIHAAGRDATSTSPLFWLRMEPERPLRAMSVRLTAWPGGQERLVATSGAHGEPVRWRL